MHAIMPTGQTHPGTVRPGQDRPGPITFCSFGQRSGAVFGCIRALPEGQALWS